RKGIAGLTMHNEQMRGSQVFGAIVDSAYQLKYSTLNPEKILFKPTKFRHIPIHQRQTHLLSIDTNTLWLRDEGVVDEKEQLRDVASVSDIISPEDVFKDYPIRYMADIQKELIERGLKEPQRNKLITLWLKRGLIMRMPHGGYTLTQPKEISNEITKTQG
ncbi:MAG: hypothetical protein ACP5JH_12135, partial [Bacteroidota bacterium]